MQVAHSVYAVRSSCFCLAVLTERKKLDVCSVLIHIHSQTTLDASRIFYTHHYHSSSVVFRLPPLVPGGLNATRQKREKKRHLSAHKRPLFCLADGPAATVVVTCPENTSNIGKEKQLKEDYSEAPMTVWCRGAANIKCFKRSFPWLLGMLHVQLYVYGFM